MIRAMQEPAVENDLVAGIGAKFIEPLAIRPGIDPRQETLCRDRLYFVTQILGSDIAQQREFLGLQLSTAFGALPALRPWRRPKPAPLSLQGIYLSGYNSNRGLTGLSADPGVMTADRILGIDSSLIVSRFRFEVGTRPRHAVSSRGYPGTCGQQ